jgi:hypothetical protein
MLDYFALIVLLVLIGVVIAALIMLGMMPGQIARKRGHPQADAINVCGWWGLITLGILLPVAWIWAYTKPVTKPVDASTPDPARHGEAEGEARNPDPGEEASS